MAESVRVAGYNWQRCCSSVVFGVETDINYLNTSPTAFDIETSPLGTDATILKSRMDWFGTLRARAGVVVHDSWLLYGTGGLAYGEVDHTLGDICIGCNVIGPPGLGNFAQSNKDTKVGWTAGGGVEFLHDSHWLLRTEALFVDLGSETHSYVRPTWRWNRGCQMGRSVLGGACRTRIQVRRSRMLRGHAEVACHATVRVVERLCHHCKTIKGVAAQPGAKADPVAAN